MKRQLNIPKSISLEIYRSTPLEHDKYTNRYNYILSIAFGIDTKRISDKLEKYTDLQLKNVSLKARLRYENITSRCKYITL